MVLDCNIDRPIIKETGKIFSPIICSFKAIEFFEPEVGSCVLVAVIAVTFGFYDHPPVGHRVSQQGGKDRY